MEEKRKDGEGTLAASSTAAATPTKLSEPASELPSSRRRGGNKRKASNISSGGTSTTPTTSSKRQAREKSSANLCPPIHNGPWTRARQLPNSTAAAASPSVSSAASVKSRPEALAPPDAAAEEAVKTEEELNAVKDWEALEAKIEAEYEAVKSRDENAHVVPVFSGWFSWTKIHPIEERALPSFFNGKSETRTPEIYMDIRNYILKKYHANPNTKVESKDLSEVSVGELDARQEVMEFLDFWGLINYHPLLHTDLTAVGAKKYEGMSDPLIENLYRFETEQTRPPVIAVPGTNMATPAVPSGLFPESSISEELARLEGPAVDYHCNSCSTDCSRKRYHCQKQADFDLCSECFNSGKFGSDMYPSDFILMESAEAAGASGGRWTDQETLLLLEALELYKENWNEIAEHVATKTKAQCILHFVQMPIEDMFLDHDNEVDENCKENANLVLSNDTTAPKVASEATENKESAKDNQLPVLSLVEISKTTDVSEPNIGQEIGENCALEALKGAFEAVGYVCSPADGLSFAEASNPVMALAAFLVHLVEPNVATVSAHSSLKSIAGLSSGVQLAARHCFLLDDPPDDKKTLPDSERAVTEMAEQGKDEDEDLQNRKQEEKKSDTILNDKGLSNDHQDDHDKDSLMEEKEETISSNGKSRNESHALKEPDVIVSDKDLESAQMTKSENPDLPREHAPSTVEESNDLESKVELPPTSKESEGEGAHQSTDAPTDEDMKFDCLPSGNKEPEQPMTSTSRAEDGASEEEARDHKNKNNNLEDKSDSKIDKLKRAAVTALSAAAVKANLLAKQEEEQIRWLTTSLIEKQLCKLETKLWFFTEMETIVTRVREQLERSKQRLFHERAQIIATRFGMSGPSSRPLPQSLPVNRAALAFANSLPRPTLSLNSERPPVLRPVPASVPTSNPFMHSTVTGNSVRPSNQDKLS